MSLIALRNSDDTEIESFSTEPTAWRQMGKLPLGTFLMPQTRWPAVLKTSPRGLQFFAHAPGYAGAIPKPKSEAHQLAQIEMVRSLRGAGYAARLERPGATPSGDLWQADVYCETAARRIAIEVQLSSQTLYEYEERTAKYRSSGVEAVWLVGMPLRWKPLHDAIWRRLKPQDLRRRGLPHLTAIPLELGSEKNPDPAQMRAVGFISRGAVRIPLGEFAIGVMTGRLQFFEDEWRWE